MSIYQQKLSKMKTTYPQYDRACKERSGDTENSPFEAEDYLGRYDALLCDYMLGCVSPWVDFEGHQPRMQE